MKKLHFDEKKHQYTYGVIPEKGEIFISVTTLLGLFKPKFDSDFWSYYHALRLCLGIEDKKEFSKKLRWWGYDFSLKTKEEVERIAYSRGVTIQDLLFAQKEVKSNWKDINVTATTKGTKFHNSVEDKHYKDGGFEYEGVFTKLIENLSDELIGLNHPVYTICIPELRLFNEQYGIAGTMDQNFMFPNKEFDINDWKTNKKIDLTNQYQNMLGPLSHLQDCSYNHYSLQISIYAWMLEQFGYIPRMLKFTHIKTDENNNVLESTIYHTHYMKKEVEDMLEYYRINKDILLKQLEKK